MKYIIVLLLGIIGQSQAQITTYNKRLEIGCHTTLLTGIEVTDSIYYATGVAYNNTDNCRQGALFARFDSLGNLLSFKIHTDSFVRYETWHPTLHTDADGNFINAGEVIDTAANISAMLIKYDQAGDLLWTQTYSNFHASSPSQSWNRTDDFKIANDSTYLLAGQTLDGFQLLNISPQGHVRWSKAIPCNGNLCSYHDIWPLEDGFVVGYSNSNATQVFANYTLLTVLKKYDYAGNELWTWQSDSSLQLGGANQIIPTKDKGWAIATSLIQEMLNNDGVTSRILMNAHVFKLDSNRQIVWHRPLRAINPSPVANTTRLIELEDSSLLTFGMQPDTFTVNGSLAFQYNAVVSKVAANGDSLWSHHYHYFQQPHARHELFDVEQTSDKGFLIAGRANGLGQGTTQQAWLLKLDQHGCLIPGCHLPDTSVIALKRQKDPSAVQLTCYPNPTTDYLNVQWRDEQGATPETLTFNILNEQGQVVQTQQATSSAATTFIFSVTKLPVGWYILQTLKNGKVYSRTPFVKQ